MQITPVSREVRGSSESNGPPNTKRKATRMEITFLSNSGGGFSKTLEVARGTTMKQFFEQELGADSDPHDYTIRRNGRPVTGNAVLDSGDNVEVNDITVPGTTTMDDELQDGDRVTASPKNMIGA